MMTSPYEPSSSLSAKITRKLVPYQRRRNFYFKTKRPVVSFTFDDFPRSAITNGSDILEREGWHSTFYVAAGLAGINNHHGQHFLPEDLLTLKDKGHEIAGHTYGHKDCERLSVQDALKEIDRNKSALMAMGITDKIDHFAYPFGATSVALKQGLQNQFKTMRGIKAGVHRNKADLNGLMSAPLFSGKKLTHAMSLISSLKTRPGWLTLFVHDIRNQPSQWGCTPDEFMLIIQAVKNSGAIVLPIGTAVQQLEAQYE